MPISVASPLRIGRIGASLRALVRATLVQERRTPGEISVVLGNDALLRDLNRRYRSLDRTTDVLSFGYDSGAKGARRAAAAAGRGKIRAAPVDGDLVISLDRVAVQARRYRVRPGRELARLVVHGALHLAGLDHHEPAARRLMRRAETRALRASADAVMALERTLDLAVDRKGGNKTH
jgi:probable rRNA maturation factor